MNSPLLESRRLIKTGRPLMQWLTDEREKEREKMERARKGEERDRPIFIAGSSIDGFYRFLAIDQPSPNNVSPPVSSLTGWMAEFSPWIRSRPIEPRLYAAHCCVHAFPSGRRRLAEQQAFKPRCGEWNGARNSSSPDNGSIHPLITWDGAQVW